MKMSNPYLFLLGSIVCLGISNLLFKTSNNVMGAIHTTFYYYLFGILVSGVFLFLSGEKKPLSFFSLRYLVPLSILMVCSVYLYTKSLKEIPVSIASSVRLLAFLVSVIASIFFLKETIN